MSNERKSMHGEWSSQWAFLLAATGAAVGLGNIWKFPYIAGQNGGGAFVLFYPLCVAVLGIPILTAEIMLGRHGRQNPAFTMEYIASETRLSKYWYAIGFLTILAGFLILSYYCVIAGWGMDYLYQSSSEHFANPTPEKINFLFNDLVSRPGRLLFWQSTIAIPTIFVVAAGVHNGLERTVKIMFPVMLGLLLLMVGYSLSTGYFAQGLTFLFTPDFSKLTPNGMLIALGHAFFTLSLATGSIMMYGAYLPQNASIPKAAIFIAAADTLIALIAGLAIFPIVFAHGLEPSAGPGLIFKTLPLAFGQMPYGHFFAAIFFMMLVFAAFTSAISLLEPMVAWLMEAFKLHRVQAALYAGFTMWFLGLGTVFSFNIWADYTLFGLNFFECLDYLTANIMLPLGGLFIAVFTAWFMKKESTIEALNIDNVSPLYHGWLLILRYVSPIAISIVFLNFVGLIKL